MAEGSEYSFVTTIEHLNTMIVSAQLESSTHNNFSTHHNALTTMTSIFHTVQVIIIKFCVCILVGFNKEVHWKRRTFCRGKCQDSWTEASPGTKIAA